MESQCSSCCHLQCMRLNLKRDVSSDISWRWQLNWTGGRDRERVVVPKRRGTRVKCSITSIGLDPRDWQTIIIVSSQWTGRNRCSQHGMKINRLFFTQGFVGQQIDHRGHRGLYYDNWQCTMQPITGFTYSVKSVYKLFCQIPGASAEKPCFNTSSQSKQYFPSL